MGIEHVIAEMAAPQYGLVELGQLTAAGLRRHHVDSRLRSGYLERMRPGVFVVAGVPRSFEQTVLAAVLAAGYEPGDSDLEMRFVRAIVAGGLPEPVQQHRVTVGRRRYRIDLAYPELMIAVEIDGWEHHRTRTAFDHDRARANDLVVAGWQVLRFTSSMTDAQAVATVRTALSQKHSA
jgi:very-short-patch-repair endonuclease